MFYPRPIKALCLTIVLSSLVGCTSKVSTQGDKLADVKAGSNTSQNAGQNDSVPGGTATIGETLSQESEAELSEGCVQAWRKALKGNEKEAMAQLDDLSKKYPKALTITFMKGQVQEQLGHKQQSIDYYREAVKKSGMNSMYMFKLAEALNDAGKYKEAIPTYRNLIGLNPHFPPARIGIAKALWSLDKKSTEAREQIEFALKDEPNNKEALEFKRKMMK